MEKFTDEFSEDKQGEIMRRINVVRHLGKHIPMGQGRPKRYRAISYADVVDFKIVLNTVKSFEEFLLLI